MSNIISFFKSIRLGQILTVFLAGILVLFTTACNGDAQAKMPKGTMGDGPNPVGQTQPYEGGMNNFSDTDPGEAAKGTAAKTKALIDRAEKDINTKRVDSVDQYVDNYRSGAPIQERTNKVIEGVKGATNTLKEDVRDISEDAAANRNKAVSKAKQMGDEVQSSADSVKENAKQAGKDVGQSVKDVVGAVKNKVEDVTKAGSRTVEDAGKSVQRASETAADAVKQTTKNTID